VPSKTTPTTTPNSEADIKSFNQPMPISSDLSDGAALRELRDLQRVERLHHRILNVCGSVLIV
jgi:hypothetical protein